MASMKDIAVAKTNNKQILDIKSIKQNRNLNENIKYLIQKYGNKIVIKFNSLYVPIEIILIKKYKFPFYRLTGLDDNIFLRIDFYDKELIQNNDNSYIGYIQKSKYASGSSLVKFSLALQRALGVKKTMLYDGATMDCHGKPIDLSFIKLLENGATFYMDRGFIISPNKASIFSDKPAAQVAKIINKSIEVLKSIKIKDIKLEAENFIDLAAKAAKENYKHNIIKTYVYQSHEGNEIKTHKITNYRQEFNAMFLNNAKIISLLQTNHKYLHTFMIELFKTKCDDYYEIHSSIFENLTYNVKYGNTTIARPYLLSYQNLIYEKNMNNYIHCF